MKTKVYHRGYRDGLNESTEIDWDNTFTFPGGTEGVWRFTCDDDDWSNWVWASSESHAEALIRSYIEMAHKNGRYLSFDRQSLHLDTSMTLNDTNRKEAKEMTDHILRGVWFYPSEWDE